MKKSRWLCGIIACVMMIATFSVGALAATRSAGDSVDFNFVIESRNTGYSSNPIAKEEVNRDGYVVVTRNQSNLIANAKTAFITVKSTGMQLSDEVVLQGVGEFSVDYNAAGDGFIGDVCVRANAAVVALLSDVHCQGQYYPDGR